MVVPLLVFITSIACGKAFSRKNNYKIDPTQELIALGMANVLGSFVSSYPITASFSRTAINSQCGVKTPAAGRYLFDILESFHRKYTQKIYSEILMKLRKIRKALLSIIE